VLIAVLSVALALVLWAAVSAAIPARAEAVVPSGSLSQLESPFNCVSVAISGNLSCGTLIPSGLENQVYVAVSPDNHNVYAAASNALIEFSRNQATGALKEIGCVTGGKTECSSEHDTSEAMAMNDPAAIAISPHGADVYVTAEQAGAVVAFSRESSTGLLTETGCISNGTGTKCSIEGVPGLKEPGAVVVSPNEKNVYVSSFGEQAVAEFEREISGPQEGALKQLAAPNDCISSEPSTKCGTTALGLDEASSLAVSPGEGTNVYVAATGKGGPSGGDIAEFERKTSGLEEGALKQLAGSNACLTSTGVAGCESALDINGAGDIIVSPDGENVYANSFVEDAVLEFSREPSGDLKQLAGPNTCISSAATTPSGCTPVKGIEGPFGVAISPAGSDLYAAGVVGNAIAEFSRNTSKEGALEPLEAPYECITENSSGCGTNNAVGLKAAWLPAVSPDGTNVYLGGEHGGLVEFASTIEPTVTGISPSNGSEAGSTEVTIKGSGFAQGASVDFGSTPALSVTVESAESITAVSPAGSGDQAVTVTNPAGTSAPVAGDEFAYTTPTKPTIGEIAPTYGNELGATKVTIIGSEFLSGSEVHFGSSSAESVTVNSGTSITATSPPGIGTVNVSVTTPYGTSAITKGDEFKYVYVPPRELGGMDIAGYCESIGDDGDGGSAATYLKGEVNGPEYAYNNWACVEGNGHAVEILTTGPAPSMENLCEVQYGVPAYGYASEPNTAFSWNCYEKVPVAESKGGGGGGVLQPLAKLASEDVLTPQPIVVPPPVLAKTGNVAPVSGKVLVELPGTKTFVPLSSLKQIPFGTIVEATHGTVSVTSAQPNGTTQTGEFFEGQFILTQERDGQIVATLSGGNFSVCPTARERAHIASAGAPLARAAVSGKHVVRKLWANAHGKFSTKGNYAAGAVQGTEWLTEDLCEGTLIKVTRDKVAVTNLVNHKHVEVKTGHHYLAKAP
jgi:hypothetical protein